MSSEDNIKTVQAVYEAFLRADGEFILESVTNDIDWGTETTSTAAPWFGIRHGKAEVGRFFEEFATAMSVTRFEPTSYAANDTEVHTIVQLTASHRETSQEVSLQLHHYFRFDGDKIAYYRGTEDTAIVAELFA